MADPLRPIRDLFGQYDDEFLRAVYVQSNQDVQRTIENLIEFGQQQAQMDISSNSKVAEADDRSNSLGLLSQVALLTNANPMDPRVVELRKHQLAQVQRYLVGKGLATMSIEERKAFLTENPTAMADLKLFLYQVGLGQYNFAQLHGYFRESGLSFSLPAPPPQQRQQQQQQQPPHPLLKSLLTVEHRQYDQYTFSNALVYGQKQQFHEVGFLVVSGVVPRPLVDAALRDINLSLSNGFAPEQRAHYDATTWCADMVTSPSILDLIYRTPALALAMSLTGGVARINEASIQIRFPGHGCLSRTDDRLRGLIPPQAPINPFVPDPHWHLQWQVDDLNIPVRGQARNYTLLLCVLLSDISGRFAGNPVFYPGTHHAFQQTMARFGGAANFLETTSGLDELRRNVVINGEGVQVVGNAGDIILMHYATAHTFAPHVGSNVRYMACFRLHHSSHVPGIFRPEALDKIWLEFDGLRDLQPRMLGQPAAATCPRCRRVADQATPNARFCTFCGAPL